MSFPAIDLYTKPGSAHCDRMRQYLVDQGVGFTEYDIERDETARDRLMWVTGRLWVPTVIIEERAIIGFDQTKFDQLFEDIRERLAQEAEDSIREQLE
jgi:glutaredoxin